MFPYCVYRAHLSEGYILPYTFRWIRSFSTFSAFRVVSFDMVLVVAYIFVLGEKREETI